MMDTQCVRCGNVYVDDWDEEEQRVMSFEGYDDGLVCERCRTDEDDEK